MHIHTCIWPSRFPGIGQSFSRLYVHLFSRGSSQPGIQPRSLELQADSLPTGPPGTPRLSHSPAFPHILSDYLFVPAISYCLRRQQLKHLPVNAFGKCSLGVCFSTGQVLNQTSLSRSYSREPPDSSDCCKPWVNFQKFKKKKRF